LLSARVAEEDFAPRFQRVNLADFAQDRVASLSAIALKKNIEIELRAEAPCEAHIDKVTFTSAFDNVLDNAIRYTPAGGAIAVHVHNTPSRDVLVRVSDNGVGIPSELHQRVFERFFRVTGSDQQGSGLGLAIVKQVIDLHGGHVSLAEGVNGKGLTVELKLPVAA
jgi:two-component system sensor histidine kinase QseC